MTTLTVPLAPPQSDRGLARIGQAADYLQVCRATVYRMMDDGVLPSVQIGRARRISWAALDRYIAQQEQAADLEDGGRSQ